MSANAANKPLRIGAEKLSLWESRKACIDTASSQHVAFLLLQKPIRITVWR